MGYVYLIGEVDNKNKYKIGSTRAKDVNNRLKQLQTGNSSELFIKESYETEHPFKLEKMLHNHFKSSNLIGEWFELSESDIKAFKGICKEKEKIISSLKNNPFYFTMKIPIEMGYDKNGRAYDIDELMNTINEFKIKNEQPLN